VLLQKHTDLDVLAARRNHQLKFGERRLGSEFALAVDDEVVKGRVPAEMDDIEEFDEILYLDEHLVSFSLNEDVRH
jgi:hypothetical protein